MVRVIVARLDRAPVRATGDPRPIVVAWDDPRTGVLADIRGLVCRESDGNGGFESPRADLVAIDKQRDRRALCESSAVVGELDPDLMRACGHGVRGLDVRVLE